MKKEDLPLYHASFGRALLVVAEYPDTEDGTEAANAYMAEHQGVGLLEVIGGRLLLANKEDKGSAIEGRLRGQSCTCCASYTRGYQFHNQDTGYGLCNDCIDYCGRHFDVTGFQRTYGLRGIHYDIPNAGA